MRLISFAHRSRCYCSHQVLAHGLQPQDRVSKGGTPHLQIYSKIHLSITEITLTSKAWLQVAQSLQINHSIFTLVLPYASASILPGETFQPWINDSYKEKQRLILTDHNHLQIIWKRAPYRFM